jgi:Restriction endonuclease
VKKASIVSSELRIPNRPAQAQGQLTDLALHTLGWKSFQDLCAHICEEILKIPVEVYREAQDGGQDAVFMRKTDKRRRSERPATIQCKFTSKSSLRLKLSDLRQEEDHIKELYINGQIDRYILMTNMSVAAPVAVAIKNRLRDLGVLGPHVFGT